MAKAKHFSRLDPLTFAESDDSPLFFNSVTKSAVDLSGVRVLHFGTDTVRQLYRGFLKPGVLGMFDGSGELVEFCGYDWHAGRMGGSSGYQYRLQNSQIGIALLIKSFHVEADSRGPHLKIEVSPHAILERSSQSLQDFLDYLASALLIDIEKGPCAVHIAMDVQGWSPGDDFEAKLHCRARRVRSFTGIQSVDFDSDSARYGRGQSFLFGSVSGVQLAVYNKTIEARARDKLDFWRGVWNLSGGYDSSQDVYRIEFRFHHSVIVQFSEGTRADDLDSPVISSCDYHGIFPHLTGLWRYGLDNFRYLYSPRYFDPFWSLIRGFSLSDDVPKYDYRRHYKKADGFSGKNVDLAVGNLVTLFARERLTAAEAFDALRSLPVYSTIEDHYTSKGKQTWQIRQHISRLLTERYVRWGVCV